MKELLEMFLIFAKIGLFTFGGGYTMLPILEKEVVEGRHWISEEDLIDYYAIGQCVPGVISVNCAIFIGNSRKGIPGAVFSTIGVVFPSFVIITVIAAFLSNFQDLVIVQNAFGAIRVTVGVLITNAIVKLWKTSVKDKLCIIFVLAAFLISIIFDPSPILIVIASAALGLVIPVIRGRKNG